MIYIFFTSKVQPKDQLDSQARGQVSADQIPFAEKRIGTPFIL